MDRKHLLSTSVLTGLLVGLLPSAIVILWMVLSPYEESAEVIIATLVCFEVICASMWGARNMSIYLAAVRMDLAGSVLQQNTEEPQQLREPEPEYEEEPYEEIEVGPVPLAVQVMRAAYEQARWQYELGVDPTRKKMMAQGTTQPIWNSGRDIIKVMGLADDSGTWVEIGWEQVNGLFLRIKPEEEEDRLWVPTLKSRGLRPIRVSETLSNNRHTEIPTTLLGSV